LVVSDPVSVIAVRGVTVRRGSREIVRDVSLSIRAGEHIAMIGPNGAGKSTLLNVISGDIAVDPGDVLLLQNPVSQMNTGTRARIRAVYSQSSLPRSEFLARDVVAMGRRPLPVERRVDDDMAIARAMAQTETKHLANRQCSTLSEGERARVSIARIMAQEAPLILLDEPTAALDVRHQHLIMHRMRAIAQVGGAVVSIVHDINLALLYADRVAVMRRGELVAFDTPATIANEALLRDVFECPMTVVPHPTQPVPMIVPLANGDDASIFFASAGEGGRS
jgi:iron complex transport system ATP-binding protein